MLIISASMPEFTTSSSRSANAEDPVGLGCSVTVNPIHASHSPPATPAGERLKASKKS